MTVQTQGSLKQGRNRVFDHAVLSPLRVVRTVRPSLFYLSLFEEIKDQLANVDLPNKLEPLVELAIKVDNQLCVTPLGCMETRTHSPLVSLR